MKLYKSVRFAGLFFLTWTLAAPGVSSTWQGPQREQKDERPKEKKPVTNEEAAKLKELEQRACGPKQTRYLVRVDTKQHPTPEAPPDKALVYVFAREWELSGEETKLAMDGQWVGANRANMYFFFEVEPGQHSFCSDVEGHHTVLTLTVKPGRTYYLEQGNWLGFGMNTRSAVLDEQEGKSRLAKSHLSISIQMEEAKLKEMEEKACGPNRIKHLVRVDTKQHPTPEAPPDKALIYVVRPGHAVETTISEQYTPTTIRTSRVVTKSEVFQVKLAADGQWVGVNYGDTYFFFVLEPGEHYFCSRCKFWHGLLALAVEAGRIYYLQHNCGDDGFKLSLLNEQEGQQVVAESILAISEVKGKNK